MSEHVSRASLQIYLVTVALLVASMIGVGFPDGPEACPREEHELGPAWTGKAGYEASIAPSEVDRPLPGNTHLRES